MTDTELQSLRDATAELERLLDEEVKARLGVTLIAEMLVSMYPNDERLARLREAVKRYADARKRSLEYAATDLHQALLPFDAPSTKGVRND